jgi:low affinity Fe/Cu permease
MSPWSSNGRSYAAGIGVLVLWGLFKLNWFSAGWNIVVGLVVTAVLFILTGMIGGGEPES